MISPIPPVSWDATPANWLPDLHNRLEPEGLLRHIQAHPPIGFSTLKTGMGAPAFCMRFDLLTTMSTSTRKRLTSLPGARWWRRLFHLQTCFIGSTVSEYAPLPTSIAPETFVRGLLTRLASGYPLLIIKDIPTEATLVGEAAYAYSQQLAEACQKNGFISVEGQALAYMPIDFVCVDEVLRRLSRARRRDLRRKLRSASALTIEAVPTGDVRFQDETWLALLYSLYLNVYDQSEIHFDRLTPGFFRALLQDAGSHGIVFLYRDHAELVGYNLCFVERHMLVDKYIGFAYPQAREYNLYTVSWFHNLEYARARIALLCRRLDRSGGETCVGRAIHSDAACRLCA